MINPESRTREWIESLRTQYPYIKDASLLEKPFSMEIMKQLFDTPKISKLLRLMKLLTGNVSRTIDSLAKELGITPRTARS